MLIQFTLRFHTVPGQSMHISSNDKELGNNNQDVSYPMLYLDSNNWRIQLDLDITKKTGLEYRYILKDDYTGIELHEWRERKLILDPAHNSSSIEVYDTWSSPGTIDNCFETSMFDYILPKQKTQKLPVCDFTHRFEVNAPLLKTSETIILTGNCTELGNWDPLLAPQMKRFEKNRFALELDLSGVNQGIEYKYGIFDRADNRFVKYEEGFNRYAPPSAGKSSRIFCIDENINRLTDEFWRGAGVAIPVFALRTKDSLGVGEFPDLKLMADWAKKAKMSLIQILPVNDTTANNNKFDTYPYAGISVFALHPQFLKISALPYKMPEPFHKKLKERSAELNSIPSVPYEEMMSSKWEFIREIFKKYRNDFLQDEEFRTFFKANEDWLVPYAVFCVKRDENSTPDFSKWSDFNNYDKAAAEKFAEDNEAVQINYFVQFHLHLQLSEAAKYLHSQGIVLKGDIPIGIYRYSCDAWVEPELFNMDMQAGAPPDSFAIKGQNWGFPTYNWDKMAENDFKWWKDRFQQMSHYFDSFRIDHILGFFRIWQIPMNALEGIMGFFMPAIPVHINELRERGIHFDYHRFCRPFITEEILWRVFGENMHWIKDKFLDYYFDRFFFKPEFDTQKKIISYFDQHGGDENIKYGLFDLLSNFLFIEVEGSGQTQFHPRYGFGSTMSFQYLDEYTKNQLYQIYDNYFYVRQDAFWEVKGMQKLPAIKRATNMLICGEDLGMVPGCVPKVMKQLGILSLEVQRMPKNPKTMFFHPYDAPYMSVVSPSSHDTSTLRGWWEEDREVRQKFYNNMLGEWGEAPDVMTVDILKRIISQHFYSKAMLAIFPIQDYLGINEKLRHPDVNAERINIPAKFPHFWNYRMHISLEDLLYEKDFNAELAEMVQQSGRFQNQ
jgi:4-alpha-glucanotransferase